MPNLMHDDLAQLRQLVARLAETSGMQRRALEREIGLASGSLARLLDDDLDFKIEHLANLARVLRIPPGELLALGCPQTTAAARHRLVDWIGPGPGPSDAVANASSSAPSSPEELAAMVRAAVREELAARKAP
jgi:hypothetical protein